MLLKFFSVDSKIKSEEGRLAMHIWHLVKPGNKRFNSDGKGVNGDRSTARSGALGSGCGLSPRWFCTQLLYHILKLYIITQER